MTNKIQQAINTLFSPQVMVELRAISNTGTILSGFYTDHGALAADIDLLSADPAMKGIYVTLNPVSPVLQHEAGANVNKAGRATRTTRDGDIIERRWLLIDVDPERPSDTGSTDAEKDQASQVITRAREFLSSKGWPEPLQADSGNGFHALYPLSGVENTRMNTLTIEGVLRYLASRFNTESAKVDTAVGNPSRITKAYGSMVRKGGNTAKRPWRFSELLNPEVQLVPVTLAQLEEIDGLNEVSKKSSDMPVLADGFDIGRFIEHNHLSVRGSTGQSDGSVFYFLDECPFRGGRHSGDPNKTALIVGQTLGFKCFSDDCAEHGIADFLRLMAEQNGRYRGAIFDEQELRDDLWGEIEQAMVENEIETDEPVEVEVEEVVPAAKPVYRDPYAELMESPPAPQPYVSACVPSHQEEFPLDIPADALYGWLADKARELQAPMGWAYPACMALFAAHGINLHSGVDAGHIRPTVYVALLARPGVGKSYTVKRARRAMPGHEVGRINSSTPGSDAGLYLMLGSKRKSGEEDTQELKSCLLWQDELVDLLAKLNIQGSSLAPTLCKLWSDDEAGSSNKQGYYSVRVRLSMLGALAVRDNSEFTEHFGSQTTRGLYDRFLLCPGPSRWEWDDAWRPTIGEAPHYPVVVEKVHPDCYGLLREWRHEGNKLGLDRGRMGEVALRIALITASANHERIISPDCLRAALRFMEWQELVRSHYSPGVSQTLEGKVTETIINELEKNHCHDGKPEFTVSFRQACMI
jgi:hypothetical protein